MNDGEYSEKIPVIHISDIIYKKLAELGGKAKVDVEFEFTSEMTETGTLKLIAENVENMKKSGKIVFLTATPQTIYERVKNSSDRPILNGHMNVPYIAELMEKRRPVYEGAAELTISTDGKSREEIADEIIRRLEE